VFKIGCLFCATALLVACGAPESRRTPGETSVIAPRAPPGAEITSFPIDTAQSELQVLVYRAGPMGRFGHNHVIVNHNLGGSVGVGADPTAATLVLRIPVGDFVVDDARARAAAGADFAEPISEDARLGTRRNMLGAAVLGADQYPIITLTSLALRTSEDAKTSPPRLPAMLSATLAVDLAGHRSTLVAPFKLEAAGGALTASGTVLLHQSALGMTRFGIMLGALQVQDEISVTFHLVAATHDAHIG
jgi:YceI-like domain